MKSEENAAETVTEIVMPHEGGPEVLQVDRRDSPSSESGQSIVRLEAAGVSFAETQMLKGRYFGLPKFHPVPGYDLVRRTLTLQATRRL